MSRNCTVLLAAILVLGSTLSLEGQDAAGEAQKLYQDAQDLAKSQKFDQAAAAMKKAIQLTPKNDLYLAIASDYLLKAGKHADGLAHAEQAIKLNDKVGAYYVLAAANALGEQDLGRAREHCEAVLERGPKVFGQGPCNDALLLKDLLIKKTYTLFWELDPKKIRYAGGTVAIALPKGNLPYQTVTYEVTGVQRQQFVKGEVNDLLYVVPLAGRPFSLTTKVTVEPYSFKKDLAKATPKPVPADVRAAYLGPCFSINPSSPVLKKLAAELKGSDTVETARNILAWMKKNVEYKLEKGTIAELDFKMVDDIVQRGHAECRGYAMLFVALCRAADIPARPIWGLTRVAPGQDKRFGDIASHNWSELYVAGLGWIPVDPQKPETLGCMPTSCMRVFMDAKKTRTSNEILPMQNLLYMFGDKLKFEESRN